MLRDPCSGSALNFIDVGLRYIPLTETAVAIAEGGAREMAEANLVAQCALTPMIYDQEPTLHFDTISIEAPCEKHRPDGTIAKVNRTVELEYVVARFDIGAACVDPQAGNAGFLYTPAAAPELGLNAQHAIDVSNYSRLATPEERRERRERRHAFYQSMTNLDYGAACFDMGFCGKIPTRIQLYNQSTGITGGSYVETGAEVSSNGYNTRARPPFIHIDAKYGQQNYGLNN